MDLNEIDIRTLLPQRAPMVMVDSLLEADNTSAVSVFRVRTDNLFVENGRLKAYALMENMAQTCAAQLGVADRFLQGCQGVRIGYIGSIKAMRVEAEPHVGDTLTTRMEVLADVGDLKMVSAETFVDGCRIASAELKIALSGERIKQ